MEKTNKILGWYFLLSHQAGSLDVFRKCSKGFDKQYSHPKMFHHFLTVPIANIVPLSVLLSIKFTSQRYAT